MLRLALRQVFAAGALVFLERGVSLFDAHPRDIDQVPAERFGEIAAADAVGAVASAFIQPGSEGEKAIER